MIMSSFGFNSLYIIESLGPDDEKTGLGLKEYLDSWISLMHPNLKIEYIPISNKEEFFLFFDSLYNEVSENGIRPILHFEVHGSSDKTGIVLSNNELVTFNDLGDRLMRLNQASECNLFISMAVCHGLYSLFAIHPTRTMPFCGVLGSFNIIYENDLKVRFEDFYEEFFNSLDLTKAYQKLLAANTGLPGDYRIYMAELLFLKTYKEYLEKECSPEGIEKRAKECYDPNIGYDFPTFFELFKNEEIRTREEEFFKFRNTFFMTDSFPQNIARFNLPSSTTELLEQCNKYGL